MEWVFLRFKLASLMPWSDVRRIPQVHVGGLSIHITESLSSSKGRRKSGSTGNNEHNRSSSIKGNNINVDGDGGTSGMTLQHTTTNSTSADWLAGREQQDGHQEGRGAVVAVAPAAPAVGPLARDTSDNSSGSYGGGDGLGTPKRRRRRSIWPSSSSSKSTSFQQPEQHIDRRDSWAHRGRKASIPRATSAGGLDVSGSGSGIGDGYEWERVAQATLEHALGNEFTAKYRVRHETIYQREGALAALLCFLSASFFLQICYGVIEDCFG